MTSVLLDGQRTWEMSRDEKGHRTYKIKYRVECLPTDGPAVVINTPGLPVYGSPWIVDGDVDLWAFCKYECTLKPVTENEPNTLWDVEFTFSTKPDVQACKSTQVEDPLLEPVKVSGSFVRYQEEAYYDRFGAATVNSAHEQIRGHEVQFDANRPQVKIEQNVPALEYALLAQMQDKVNAYTLWGLPPRTIKLSAVTWERKYYAICSVYYTRTFEFDVRYDTFDKNLLDEGTKVLSGHWDESTGAWILDDIAGGAPDEANPQHFIRFQDRLGNYCRVVLNGHGRPAGVIIPGSTTYYISTVPNNTNSPDASDLWVAVSGNFTDPIQEWVAGSSYEQGTLVAWDGLIYVADEEPVLNNVPPDDPLQALVWIDLGAWNEVPVNRGSYVTAFGYDQGDVVSLNSSTTARAGKIHLEKYDEADFLVLGIPIVL